MRHVVTTIAVSLRDNVADNTVAQVTREKEHSERISVRYTRKMLEKIIGEYAMRAHFFDIRRGRYQQYIAIIATSQ